MKLKFEFSAGGIVYKRRTKNEERKDFMILVAQHSGHHGWVFPKGLIGDKKEKETKENAALREVEEETGIKGKIIKPLQPVTYWYNFEEDPSAGSGRVKIKKTVYYFLMEYISGDTKNHDFEMENVEWIDIGEVEKRLSYKSDKGVWKIAQKLLETSH